MANIPKQSVKNIVRRYFKVNITDDGAAELAKMLEGEAKRISKFAVANAKKDKRDRVTRKDVREYVLKASQ